MVSLYCCIINASTWKCLEFLWMSSNLLKSAYADKLPQSIIHMVLSKASCSIDVHLWLTFSWGDDPGEGDAYPVSISIQNTKQLQTCKGIWIWMS